jgi:DNA-binding response OmpR family regulator
VRGGAAEFRRFGLSIVVRQDIVAALAEVVHDPAAMLVVSAELPLESLRDVLDLAVATCRSSVMLGMTSVWDAEAARVALDAGVQSIVDLPLSAERLARTLRTVPSGRTATAPITVGKLTIDAGAHRLDWAGAVIDVTPREFEAVLELARRYPGVATLDQLAQNYPGSAADPFAAVRVVITHVRSRIFQVAGPSGSAIIQTVRGVGYRLAG